jgi:iron complex outermembrane receptor protein
MFSSLGYMIITLLIFTIKAQAQSTSLSLTGFVMDESSREPISFANIILQENGIGGISDAQGYFELSEIPPGSYHLVCTHIGCTPYSIFIELRSDTTLQIFMDHSEQALEEISITGERDELTFQEKKTISERTLARSTGKDLATIVKKIPGVHSIQTGSRISKPLIQGLYGNRIIILNNGIPQSGQQWGVDHSPEIDPLAANSISVIKGVSAVEFQGSSLGSVILVEPGFIPDEPHVHGSARYSFQTNGLGHGINLSLHQNKRKFGWRASGTLKKIGDQRTPDYFLNNTGAEEANLSLELNFRPTHNWTAELYASTYNARLGVLRGSQIGNLTDLESAIGRSEPFFTQETFSYEIDAPRQGVSHHLGKARTQFILGENKILEATYALQLNYREEFDVRRGGRSNIPSLSIDQITQFVETKYLQQLSTHAELKAGLQFTRIDNTNNNEETGILPLIPDYISKELGLFAIYQTSFERFDFELGGRYDQEERNVAAISLTAPREIVRYNELYHNFNAGGSLRYRGTRDWVFGLNLGVAARNPEVNELYSNGLHQGVSGIEEGDPDLTVEQSLKTVLSLRSPQKNKLKSEILVYYQLIDNFIYLDPQDEFRLTIRGAFPVFAYQQTNARLFGVDFAVNYDITEQWNANASYSFLDGLDRTNDIPLVFMPSNRLEFGLSHFIYSMGSWDNLEISVNNQIVFEQKNLLEEQDFLAPPPTYSLLGLELSAERRLGSLGLETYIRATNLLNVRYRDYLNRQRYFADDLGFNLIFGVNLSF